MSDINSQNLIGSIFVMKYAYKRMVTLNYFKSRTSIKEFTTLITINRKVENYKS